MTTVPSRRGLRLVLAAAALCGVGVTSSVESAPVAAQTSQASWTLIYYGAADNDLEAALVADVVEMTQAGFGGEVAMYGLIDRSPVDYSDPYGEVVDGPLRELGDFSGTKAFRVVGDELLEDLDLGEMDMADPDTLAWFVAEVMRVSPSDHTALIMSDHGLGAYSFGVDEGTDPPTDMTAQEIATALRSAVASAGRPLDVLAFDACLMANFEMTGWLAGSADLLVASEDVIPSTGFQYRDLRALTEDPSMDPTEFASLLVESYATQYATSEFASTSLSVTDLSSAVMVDKAVSSLARALVETDHQLGFRAAVADSTSVLELENVYGFVDLGDLALRLAQPGNPDEVRLAADAVYAAVDRAVVEDWGGLARTSATGMSIAVPTDERVFDGLSYAVLGSPDWAALLSSVFEASSQTASGDSPWTAPQPDVESFDEQGIVVSAFLDQDVVAQSGLVDALGVFGVPTESGGLEVLMRYPAVVDSGEVGRVASSWAYQVYALDDGTTTVYPSTLLIPSEEIITASISGVYSVDGESSRASFEWAIDPQSGAISDLSLWVFNESGGGWASIAPVLGSTFSPKTFVVPATGAGLEEVLLEPLSFDDGVTIEEQSMNPGADIAGGLLAIDGSESFWTTFGVTQRP